ncbi:MAG: hypothetical protein DHS20C15_18560 [Planctomycetota bacterium]|nr:MAG: hypothetical protein DHS20C15_18560 [Planctomycetota bacterium]
MEHTLLIVDDEPKIYHALRRALHREKDWKTLYADGGDAALKLLEQESVDIVIADENMPGMNGTQLLGLVRQKYPDIIRMMLTGDARLDVVMNAVNRGEIYRFFTKPCDEAQLIISIRDALQMRVLKAESRRLLETVKRQAARLRELEGGGNIDPSLDGPVDSVGDSKAVQSDEPRSATLAELTNRNSPGPIAGAKPEGVINLGGKNAPDDVDDLLSEIRTELDDLTK